MGKHDYVYCLYEYLIYTQGRTEGLGQGGGGWLQEKILSKISC